MSLVLFGNDDDGCIHVHMEVDRLVGLQGIFQTRSGLFAKSFEGLTSNVLPSRRTSVSRTQQGTK